jgi:hypothetical protein
LDGPRRHAHTAADSNPGREFPRVESANSAWHTLEQRCAEAERPLDANRVRTQPDGCLTDPEPDIEMRQAHFCNMRSKCRCSCVLQFTRHHRVSSVLHRPPSQMIHCIVLCFGSPTHRSEQAGKQPSKGQLHIPTGGDHKPEARRELIEQLGIPS